MPPMPTIRRADFLAPNDAAAVLAMLDAYSCEPMGDSKPLADDVRGRLLRDLAARPNALAWLAWVDGAPVGLLTAYIGYSTFAAKPLVNVHDLTVRPEARGQGIGSGLLAAAEKFARELGCVSLTLEVRGDNTTAQRLYERHGFEGAKTLDRPDLLAYWKKYLV